MRWLATMSIALLLYAVLPMGSFASERYPLAPGSRSGSGTWSWEGNNPLTTAHVARGNLNVAVFGVALGGAFNPPATLTVEGLPSGSTVVQAFFYGTEWGYNETETATAKVGEVDLGTVSPAPTAHDPADYGHLALYRWDATAVVTGNGSYTFETTGLETVYGAALVVIYGGAGEPYRQIVINEGAEYLQGTMSATRFSMDGAGPGTLHVFTVADDDSDSAGESLTFNGSLIAGPDSAFNGGLGWAASLLVDRSVSVQAGENSNSVSVATGNDQVGWMLAVLSAPVPPPPVGDRDGDGILDDVDKCPDVPAGSTDANKDGCPDDVLKDLPKVFDWPKGVDPQMIRSLQAKVSAAIVMANTGDICGALESLNALKNQIRAQTGKKIDAQTAQILQQFLDEAIASLKSQPGAQDCKYKGSSGPLPVVGQ